MVFGATVTVVTGFDVVLLTGFVIVEPGVSIGGALFTVFVFAVLVAAVLFTTGASAVTGGFFMGSFSILGFGGLDFAVAAVEAVTGGLTVVSAVVTFVVFVFLTVGVETVELPVVVPVAPVVLTLTVFVFGGFTVVVGVVVAVDVVVTGVLAVGTVFVDFDFTTAVFLTVLVGVVDSVVWPNATAARIKLINANFIMFFITLILLSTCS